MKYQDLLTILTSLDMTKSTDLDGITVKALVGNECDTPVITENYKY